MDMILKNTDLNQILNTLAEGILIADPSGQILYCNDICADHYALHLNKLLNHNIRTIASSEVVDQSYNELAASTGKTITYEQVCSTGKRLINKTIPYFDENNNLKYIIEQTFSLEELLFNSNSEISESFFSHPLAAAQPEIKASNSEEPLLVEFKSHAMSQMYNLADNMAPKNINILILGPSGAGKSQLAKRIHNNSPRKDKSFVTINCSTIPDNLLESELFGYAKGAFSGADERGKKGLVEVADGGTIFLDEIGELPLSIQSKLLQLVQDRTYLPIGGIKEKHIDARIIAATNQDLFEHVQNGQFRADLYYRLAVVTITMPPLSDCPEDIKRLITHFTHVFNHKHNTNVIFAKPTLDLLLKYSWPGNIRELEHLVEFLILNSKEDYITPSMLPVNIIGTNFDPSKMKREANNTVPQTSDADFDSFVSLNDFNDTCERMFIRHFYQTYNSSYKLAERLKISQSSANRLIKKYIEK